MAFDTRRQHAYIELEQERLTTLIHEWVECERERSAFAISDLECEKILQLDGLSLKLKVDRIDRTADGKTVLIDYKTGAVQNINKWFGERIEDPQLPLYSLEIPADAITFASIRRGDTRYRGLSREDNLVPKVRSNFSRQNPDLETWDDVLAFWKQGLNDLASEFLEGRLRVEPLHVKDTCKYCDQLTLCRKTELWASPDGEEE